MSTIEWTDETWNPVTGCTKVSPGCDNCYMFAQYPRLRGMGVRGYDKAPDVVQLLPERLETPLRWRSPRMVFVNSMSDLFHPHVPYSYVAQVFAVMSAASAHTFQILTKRPGRAVDFWVRQHPRPWPRNVWIGTSVESQKYAPRLTVLARMPKEATIFVSAEPLLGPLNLRYWLPGPVSSGMTFTDSRGLERYVADGSFVSSLDWVIVGGESGPGARPMADDWAREIRDDAAAAGVPYFLKQLGGVQRKRGHDEALLDGRLWRRCPMPNPNWRGRYAVYEISYPVVCSLRRRLDPRSIHCLRVGGRIWEVIEICLS